MGRRNAALAAASILLAGALLAGARGALAAEPPSTAREARAALGGSSIVHRIAACRVLGRDGTREDVPALVDRLGDVAPAVREAAVDALSDLGHEIAVPALVRAFDDPSPAVRGRALIGVGRIGGRYAIPDVVRLLADPNVPVRLCAVQALGSLDATLEGPRIRAALEGVEAAGDPDHVALATGIVALARVEGKAALPGLFARAREADALDLWLVRSSLVWAVGETRDAARLPFVRRALDEPDERVAGPAARVLLAMGERDAVVARLSHEDPSRRRVAVAAIAERGEPDSLEPLRRALGDEDARVALEAAVGLSKLGERESFPALVRGLASPDPSVWTACARELDRAYGAGLGRDADAWARWYMAHRDELTWDAEERAWRRAGR